MLGAQKPFVPSARRTHTTASSAAAAYPAEWPNLSRVPLPCAYKSTRAHSETMRERGFSSPMYWRTRNPKSETPLAAKQVKPGEFNWPPPPDGGGRGGIFFGRAVEKLVSKGRASGGTCSSIVHMPLYIITVRDAHVYCACIYAECSSVVYTAGE